MHQNSNPLRERVERGVYRRKTRDGETRYEVTYLDSDSRQRWRTVSSLREARQLRAELVSKVARGERVAPSRATLREFAGEWIDAQEARLRPGTHARYKGNLRLHVLPQLGRLRVGEVTPDDVARLVAELEHKGKAGWTIRGCLVVLGRVLGSAERRGLIVSNPVRKLERGERPRVERRELPSLDREAVGRLIGKAPARYRTLIAVSALTGLRQSEALGLRWQDVDVKAGALRIRCQLDRSGKLVEPKTQAAKRDVPIPPSLGMMLTAHRLASQFSSDDHFVFASSTGRPLGHRNIVRRGLEKAIEAAELPKLTWHDLRHVAASALIAEGASVAYVSRLLGHANPAITLSIYAHEFARAEHADRTRDAMEAAFGELLRLAFRSGVVQALTEGQSQVSPAPVSNPEPRSTRRWPSPTTAADPAKWPLRVQLTNRRVNARASVPRLLDQEPRNDRRSVRDSCEIAVARDGKRDCLARPVLGPTARIRRQPATSSEDLGSLCKPEVTGSIPVPSIFCPKVVRLSGAR